MTTLAELRQANLQEQKQQEEKQNGKTPEAPIPQGNSVEENVLADSRQSPPQAPTQQAPATMREHVAPRSQPRSAGRPDEPRRRQNMSVPGGSFKRQTDKESLEDILPAISKAVVSLAAQAAVNEGEPEKSAVFLSRIRGSLNHKVLYPSGVKTTVDMSPALFHRAKKYCLDHGNVTLRQLFLDLMTEFLAEEGY